MTGRAARPTGAAQCVALVFLAGHAAGCTTVAAGRGATADGSVLASHSNDGDGGTVGNLAKVPPRAWPPGASRPVSGGSVPQVPFTHGYFTKVGGYASVNEFQVGLAESTCNSVLPGNRTRGAALNIVDLGELGLERSNTSRSCVETMGALAERYGYHDAGESLLVVDPREAWVFHVSPDPTQRSAVWCAQRIPDTHVAVVANSFTIRAVATGNPGAFLCSSNLESAAAATGRWSPGRGPVDFTRVFSGPEMGKKYTSGRRMWRIYSLLGAADAAAALPATYGEYVSDAPYPATLPARKGGVTAGNVTAVMRDFFGGTPYDMSSQRMASGPGDTPDRWLAGRGESEVEGAWERAISFSRTIVSYVVQARGWLPREVGATLWFSMHAAHTSLYVPFAVGHTLAADPRLPPGLTNNSLSSAGRGVSLFQAARFVHNAAQHRFSDAIAAVRAAQAGLEGSARALQAQLDASFVNGSLSAAGVAARYNANAAGMIETWWALADELVLTHGSDSGHEGYPTWWLASPDVGYTRGPPPAPPVPPPLAP